ncbi:phosphonate C-P lyase system protein PhnG [Actibacterium sp. D379-3]
MQPMSHGALLDVLAKADPAPLKALAETLIDRLGEIEVVQNRTGLVMLPMQDTAGGTAFHLGEVLVSEAHILSDGTVGYGMRKGHDLEAAMAMAVVDLAVARGVSESICMSFCRAQAEAQAARETETLRRVEATRVDMETF